MKNYTTIILSQEVQISTRYIPKASCNKQKNTKLKFCFMMKHQKKLPYHCPSVMKVC